MKEDYIYVERERGLHIFVCTYIYIHTHIKDGRKFKAQINFSFRSELPYIEMKNSLNESKLLVLIIFLCLLIIL